MRRRWHARFITKAFALLTIVIPCTSLFACDAEDETTTRPLTTPTEGCDGSCMDAAAVRAMRQTIKLVYNITLQGRPVGPHDETTDCPLGGKARVYGVATSNAEQGTTDVDLTYELDGCINYEKDDEPEQNYQMVLSGTIHQTGKIAVQPSFTTALSIKSDGVSFAGTVSSPPIGYQEPSCPLVLQQDGNRLAGTICGRDVSSPL